MKAKNETLKTELRPEELKLLICWYEDAVIETKDTKSPLLALQRDQNIARGKELESMFDGRHWNRGKGRKPKAPADPGPELPMETNKEPGPVTLAMQGVERPY